MSRRIKIIITALFLVLLAIPAVHITLTWRPENPLRFHVVGERIEQMQHYKEKIRVLTLEVENTAATSIVLGYGYVEPAGEQDRPRMLGMLGCLINAKGRYDLPVTVGARQTVPCELMFEEDVPHDTPLKDVVVGYSWRSTSLKRVQDFSRWLHEHLPESIHRHVPFPRTPMDVQPLRPRS
ncbi:hypothetical protein [Roseimicrobium sp. ORNL1]|uniref:hypothetical protein n=1 Tax=Roseimicrobium sp. ORNL1 TaxID=2711231 RepID=UPI0013E12B2D|nr:hypothetical protein [Roseimicrobium sp. ORNL1]QIF01971.1 hypothetical protein G5S37_10660 [Roseimicrobium sp. ORNL1]